MDNEPTALYNDTAYIMPYNRNKGSKGYVLIPNDEYSAKVLTKDEMFVLLQVYTELLGREVKK